MPRFVIILFAVLGLLDLLYGLFFKDRISVIVGMVIVGIAFYILRFKSKTRLSAPQSEERHRSTADKNRK